MHNEYPSNITREQFERIREMLEDARKKTNRREIDLYNVFCGILYVLKSGCQWRMLPKEFPKWSTCYYYFSVWKKKGKDGQSVLEKVLKKNGWRGPTKQWSDRNHQFCNY